MPSPSSRLGAAVALIAVGLGPSEARADYGRFFKSVEDSRVVSSYGGTGGGGMPTRYDLGVECNGMVVGEIRFDYDTYRRKPDGTTTGGAALAGGFYGNSSYVLAPGHHLSWVQTIDATIAQTTTNNWGFPAGGRGVGKYPDATAASPNYPADFQRVPTFPPNLGRPDLGFEDFPFRFFSDGPQSWRGELGLVCFDETPDAKGRIEGDVLFTFLWGFDLKTRPDGITPYGPTGFGAASASYLDTLNSYYSGHAPAPPSDGRATALYTFNNECDDCFIARGVPEPTSILLVVVGAAAVAIRGRRSA